MSWPYSRERKDGLRKCGRTNCHVEFLSQYTGRRSRRYCSARCRRRVNSARHARKDRRSASHDEFVDNSLDLVVRYVEWKERLPNRSHLRLEEEVRALIAARGSILPADFQLEPDACLRSRTVSPYLAL